MFKMIMNEMTASQFTVDSQNWPHSSFNYQARNKYP